MDGERKFKVTVTSTEVVAGALPVQEHWLPLSNLDLLLPPVDVHAIFCYKIDNVVDDEEGTNEKGEEGSSIFKQKVSVIKSGLAQALVSCYAFGGEVVMNFSGEPEVLCNNRGVDFTEAFADVKLCDLDFYHPEHCFDGNLVPLRKAGVLAVQVTELKCGAIVIGCTFDHRVADAYSANMFWLIWSEMALSKPISVNPCFRRSLLNPRRPITYDSSLDDMYVPISLLTTPQNDQSPNYSKTMDPVVSRIYHISANQLCHLQTLANYNDNDSTTNEFCKRTSKLQSFSAFLWKLVASHACLMGCGDSSNICKMGIVVDGRTRISEGKDEENTISLASYFGNVLSIPFGLEKSELLKQKPLSWVVTRVQNFLEPAAKRDHFLGLIDWVEAHRPEPALAKIYSMGDEDGTAFVVSCGQRFPVSKVDFGWGKPTFGSYHFPWKGSCGYVMPMPSPSENGDWVVYMHLQQSQLDFIEVEAPNVFKPFSLQLL